MAQRTIHYLIGEMLLQDQKLYKERFRIGNILPDAYSDMKLRSHIHYVRKETDKAGNVIRYCDYEAFRREFENNINFDALYIGYYMHLIEDACFRVFWKNLGFQDAIKSTEDISFLHQDYHLLNHYIVNKYKIKNDLVMPDDFQNERINEIYPFELEGFLQDMATDFTEHPEGCPRFLTGARLDAFVEEYFPICKAALQGLLRNEEYLSPYELTW